MKKKSIKLALSAVTLGVLCLGYAGVKAYVANQEKKESEAEELEAEDVALFSASAETLESVDFFIDEKEVTFDYDSTDDLWTKRDEAAFPVNQDKLSEVAGAISGMNAERVLDDVENLVEYGLDSPQNTIFVKAGEDEITLRVGDYNEGVSQYYVTKDEDDSTVYLVAEALIEPFLGDLYDYAQGETFPSIQSANINSLEVSEKSNSYTVSQDEETSLWNVSADGKEEKADSAKATSLMSSFVALEYNDFVDYDCTDLEQYGLENSYAVITVDYTEEEETEAVEEDADVEDTVEEDDIVDGTADTEEGVETDTQETTEDTEDADADTEEDTEDAEDAEPVMVDKQLILYVGDQAEESTRYVRMEGSNEIYTISEELLSSVLGKTAEDFWDLSLGYTALEQTNHIEISYTDEDHTIDVSRETTEDEDGETQEEVTYLLDGDALDSETLFRTFYNKLTNMTAQRVLTEEYTPEADVEMVTKVTDLSGNVVEAHFYSYDTNFYAVVIDERVYLVNKVNVKDMFDAYESFLNGGEDTEE